MSGEKPDVALALVPRSFQEAENLAKACAPSSLLPRDLQNSVASVFITILAGSELGIAPMTALRTIHVIEGKPSLSSDLAIAIVKQSDVCEYFIRIESTDKIATYKTKRRDEPIPQELSFTIEEAEIAGLLTKANWKKYPKAMLRARCRIQLAREVYPDKLAGILEENEAKEIFGGGQTLSLEDLEGASESVPHNPDTGEVIDAEIIEEPASTTVPPDTRELTEEQINLVMEVEALVAAAQTATQCSAVANDRLDAIKALPETAQARLGMICRERRDALANAERSQATRQEQPADVSPIEKELLAEIAKANGIMTLMQVEPRYNGMPPGPDRDRVREAFTGRMQELESAASAARTGNPAS